ncbi:hypothetical protein T459_20105 [Capsicum annuum]|uniref:Uncharacterized protein n=1 Tax=Capsicum annuum TaxID=4072 RepID=A0A2G2Z3N2_CAPAN|nr:hypothetical protein T459_20105 [Capsicum annuum]
MKAGKHVIAGCLIRLALKNFLCKAEEETVKEVLSETPIIPPPSPPKVNNRRADFPQVNFESTAVIEPHNDIKFESTAVVKKREEMKFESTAVVKKKEEVKLESTADGKYKDEVKFEATEVSEEIETSEMCSFTESYSTTATATEKREEDGEVTQRSPVRAYRKRQHTGDIAGVRERRRPATSPDKRRLPVTSRGGVQGRGMPQQRRNVGPTNGTRRGQGDNGVRRSNSPATRSTVDVRRNVRNRSPAPAAREEDKHGNRNPTAAREGDKIGITSSAAAHEGVKLGGQSPARSTPETGESIENPVVSMECFIFL